jgi:hypothetical protein
MLNPLLHPRAALSTTQFVEEEMAAEDQFVHKINNT